MKNKNNHARSKQKRKQLRLKNYLTRVNVKRNEKKLYTERADEISEKQMMAIKIKHLRSHFDAMRQFGRTVPSPNQRKRRKLARQTNNYRKAA